MSRCASPITIGASPSVRCGTSTDNAFIERDLHFEACLPDPRLVHPLSLLDAIHVAVILARSIASSREAVERQLPQALPEQHIAWKDSERLPLSAVSARIPEFHQMRPVDALAVCRAHRHCLCQGLRAALHPIQPAYCWTQFTSR
jgi:hypothetical protein